MLGPAQPVESFKPFRIDAHRGSLPSGWFPYKPRLRAEPERCFGQEATQFARQTTTDSSIRGLLES